MKIAIGSDHGGYELKEFIKEYLNTKGHEVTDVGAYDEKSVDYPDYAEKCAAIVKANDAEFGILFCGTGIGISIAANKIDGIRAALCHDSYTAKMAKQHNNANILVLGGRVLGKSLAVDIVDTFIASHFEGGRHQGRLDKITKLEGCK